MTPPTAIDVLFEDRDLLALNKPSGLLTEGGGDREPDLEQWASAHCQRPVHCCHRLDRLTSGVVLLRKTARLNAALAQIFEGHRIRKSYWAIVEGHWDAHLRKIETQIVPDGPGRFANADRGGKPAVTTVRVLDRSADRTWLGLLLKTGRTHQARLHCQHGGCPIVGDPLYGTADPDGLFGLHARELRLPHPDGGAPLQITAPPPSRWAELLASFGASKSIR